MAFRSVDLVHESTPTIEGAGVHLRRAFGHREVPRLDPYLLLDDFRSENPLEYAAGFPWHPHRGIETVTYMLDGSVEHEDSIGNHGAIGRGDVQWMSSGSGIIHQEMPKMDDRRHMGGFQLWINIPAADKMADPRYQEVPSPRIPEAEPQRGVRARVIAGSLAGVQGPIVDPKVAPEYLDLRLEPRTEYLHRVPDGRTLFGYVVGGKAALDEDGKDVVGPENLVVFGRNGDLRISARDEPFRMLLISGQPLNEPIAWWGPIVMNDRRQIESAIEEFQNGTFVKKGAQFGALVSRASAPAPARPPAES